MINSHSVVKTEFRLELFADDTAFWIVRTNLEDIQNALQKDVLKLQKWAGKILFEVAAND